MALPRPMIYTDSRDLLGLSTHFEQSRAHFILARLELMLLVEVVGVVHLVLALS